MLQTVGTPLLWFGFNIFVLFLIILDLAVFHRKAHAMQPRESLFWTACWVSLALLFNLGVYFWFGTQKGLEFLTGYLVEYSLSVDNLFVFLMIFRYFATPAASHHRALFWGIVGAMFLRGLFILLGTALIQSLHWVIYLLGAFLILTGIKMLKSEELEVDPERNPVVRLFQKLVPTTPHYSGARLTVRENGRLLATPLMVVLVALSVMDLLFAVDSIPAIFGVTQDPFIVYASNMFAILGLRSLYFLVESTIGKLAYLNRGLSLVLAFIGVKMVVSYWFEIPIGLSLGVVATILSVSILASYLRKPAEAESFLATVENEPAMVQVAEQEGDSSEFRL